MTPPAALGQPVQSYPPGRTGVLLPRDNRRAAAVGLCMYTVSNPLPLLLHRAAFAVASLGGLRLLRGDRDRWPTPPWSDVWPAVASTVAATIGPFTHVAIYQRKQTERSGLTMTVVNGRQPVAVVKVRNEGAGLEREQVALTALGQEPPGSFLAPTALGFGSVPAGPGATLFWSAQSAVFTRPHRPDFAPPRELFSDISGALEGMLAPAVDGVPAHNDVTPWNLRLDHRGRRWLFDWEDVALAPPDADRVYFTACVRALRGTPMPGGLARAGVDHWRAALEHRRDTTVSDRDLTGRLLGAVSDYGRDA